ncbi:MAG: RHS repeat protein [Leptolyngbya sp. SIO1E4]|nr:RHS repeat protein [Leptolyngbya sp. SIO1E4]
MDPREQRTRYDYDEAGNLVKQVITRFEYDGLGRLTATVRPLGQRSEVLGESVQDEVSKSVISSDTQRQRDVGGVMHLPPPRPLEIAPKEARVIEKTSCIRLIYEIGLQI